MTNSQVEKLKPVNLIVSITNFSNLNFTFDVNYVVEVKNTGHNFLNSFS